MFCFFQHDISDDVNKGERVKLYRLLLDGSLEKEKKTGTEKKKTWSDRSLNDRKSGIGTEKKRKEKDAVGSFVGKENSERPEKWNWAEPRRMIDVFVAKPKPLKVCF